MNKYLEKMGDLGCNDMDTKREVLDSDYNNIERFYCKFVDNENKEDMQKYVDRYDIMSSIGFLLDFIRVVKEEL